MTTTKGTAVITGASSGIGATYADRLARRGYDLIVVVRNRERLETLATRLREETGRFCEIIVADLANGAELARVEQVLRSDPSITVLVNNAGVAVNGDLADIDRQPLENMILLNVLAPTMLVRAVIPGFVARGAGTVINISSALALAPEILNGSYSGTKAYVLNLSLRLDRELAGKGIRVQAVLPGATRTPMWEKAGIDIAALPASMVMEVDELVDAALAGFDLGEIVTIPSLREAADWEAFEAARQLMRPNLSRSSSATRYGVADANAAHTLVEA